MSITKRYYQGIIPVSITTLDYVTEEKLDEAIHGIFQDIHFTSNYPEGFEIEQRGFSLVNDGFTTEDGETRLLWTLQYRIKGSIELPFNKVYLLNSDLDQSIFSGIPLAVAKSSHPLRQDILGMQFGEVISKISSSEIIL